jgi:hypothetical protein
VNPDFNDMLSALSAEGVEFLLVGADAMAVHGVPRTTGDIDIWIRPSADNAALSVPVIARQDLIRNQRATGRSRDQADADRLENPE